MSPKVREDAFFVGWSDSIAPALGRFLLVVAAVFVVAAGGLGFWLGRSGGDPAESLLRLGERDAAGGPVRPDDWGGEQVLRGHVSRLGYPLLHLPASAEHPRGRVMLLSGDGKRGPDLPEPSGAMELRGSVLRRGAIEMLALDGPAKALGADGAEFNRAAREPLGRWRIAGEICDGKCYAGAMKPGAGVAHRACANLCLTGDLPAVFVAAAPVAGSHFLVLSSPDGGRPPDGIQSLVGSPVTLEGDVERVGNILVLRVDLARARRL